MQKSVTLQNCQPIDHVVNLINEAGTSEFSSSEIAAQYIYSCMLDQQDLSDESLEFHYDVLEKFGAKMDFEEVRFDIRKIEDQ